LAEIVWQPQAGQQEALFRAPSTVNQVLYGGARGGGKTASLIALWVVHADRHGAGAKGLLLRRTYDELTECQAQAMAIYPRFGAVYTKSERMWTFPNGAVIRFRYLDKDEDAMKYQGQSNTFIGIDEAGSFRSPDPIDKLNATLRSTTGVPCQMILTANPGGVGHEWLKARFITGRDEMTIFKGEDGMKRLYIPAKVTDNKYLMDNDPDYINRIKASGPPWLVEAWLNGDWNVAAGSFLEGIWQPDKHIVEPFNIPPHWERWRALDWGFSAPYAVGWFAMDYDGCIYMYRELYGYGGKPNVGTKETADDVAKAILKAERADKGVEYRNNIADPAIFANIGTDMSIGEHFRRGEVSFNPASTGRGSRVNGAHELISRLNEGSFKVFSNCKHFIRTVPTLPADQKNAEDVDTAAEDHIYDMARYAIMSRRRTPQLDKPKAKQRYDTFDYLTSDKGTKKKSSYRL